MYMYIYMLINATRLPVQLYCAVVYMCMQIYVHYISLCVYTNVLIGPLRLCGRCRKRFRFMQKNAPLDYWSVYFEDFVDVG